MCSLTWTCVILPKPPVSCPPLVMPGMNPYSNQTCTESTIKDKNWCDKYSMKCKIKKECVGIKPIIIRKKECTYKKVRNANGCYVDKETCPQQPVCDEYDLLPAKPWCK